MDLCRKNHIPVGDETSFWESEASKEKIDYLFSFYWKRVGKELLSRFRAEKGGRSISILALCRRHEAPDIMRRYLRTGDIGA